jgi:hypothetical protein
MPNLTVDLCKLALILWSGMLIISGSIWILTSQVRRLGDLLEERARTTAAGEPQVRAARAYSSTPHPTATARRHAVSTRVTRTVATGFRGPDQ